MARGSLKIAHNFAGETDYIIMVWRKSTVPLTIVGQQVYPAPHTQESILITDLDPDWYTIKFYRSVDGIALGAEILKLAGNAATGAVYITETFEYVVDRGYDNTTPPGTGDELWIDPISTEVSLRDERLLDKIYSIEIRGLGTVRVTEYNDRSDLGGGFDMINGLTWEPDQVIFVTVNIPQDIITTSGPGGVGGEVTDIVLITDNTDFDAAIHGGKLLVVQLAAGIRKISLANLGTQPDTFFKIQTHGSSYQFGVQLDVGDTVKENGLNKNVIWHGIGETSSFVIRENVLYLVKSPVENWLVGERIYGDMKFLNTLFRDGTQYNQADQPRLMELVDQLPGAFVVSEGVGVGQWGYSQVIDGVTVYPNKGKYARTDTGTPKIRVPDDRDRSIRALQSVIADAIDTENITNNPGGYQHFKTSMKGVIIGLRDGSGGSSTNSITIGGFSGQDNFAAWVANDIQHIRFNNAADGFGTVDETRMAATRLLPLIRI